MLRRTISKFTAATAAGVTFVAEPRFHHLMQDPESVLSGKEYALLQNRLDVYRSMQGEYAVKQTEMERAEKAANMCALDMAKPKGRLSPEEVELRAAASAVRKAEKKIADAEKAEKAAEAENKAE